MRIRHGKNRMTGKFAAGAAATFSLALLMTGCSQEKGKAAESAAPAAPETVTETIQNPGGQAPGDGSNNGGSNNGGNDGGGSADQGNCETDAQAQAIQDATARVNQDYPNEHGGWVYRGDSNYDTCSPLTYAVVEQAKQGNAQYGTKLIMFHEGQYVGIDSTYPQQVVKATPTDKGIHVVYKDWEALMESGEVNAAAGKYTSEVTYFWDGEKVAHEGRIPNQNLGS